MAGRMLEQGCSDEGKLKRKYEEQVTLHEGKKKNVTFTLGKKKKKRVTLSQVNQKVEKLLELMNFNPAVKNEENQTNKRVTLGEVNQKLDNILQMTGLKIEKADKVLEITSVYFYEFFKGRKTQKDKSSQS